MAHFAEIDENNKVLRVIVVNNLDCIKDGKEDEATGATFCNKLLGGNWKQTSYNTQGGVNLRTGKPIKKNYAGVGYTYDTGRDAFIPPKPYKSWKLKEENCQYEAPKPCPDDGMWSWDEEKQKWVAVII